MNNLLNTIPNLEYTNITYHLRGAHFQGGLYTLSLMPLTLSRAHVLSHR
jgi:hypothetical protein